MKECIVELAKRLEKISQGDMLNGFVRGTCQESARMLDWLGAENQQLKKERDAYKAAAESAAETELGKSLIKMTLLWSRAETEAQQLRGRKEIVEVEKNRAKYEEGWPDFFSGNLVFHESAKPIVSVMENYTGGDDVMAHTARMVDAMTAINDAVRVESASVCAPDKAAKAENSANQAAKATTGEGVKGLMVLRCKSCKDLFATFLKAPQKEFVCRCGEKIPLENLVRFSWTCSCGICNYGRTNTTDAEIPAGVTRCVCGEKSPEMVWSYERRKYLEAAK